jgi:hypothetical protein
LTVIFQRLAALNNNSFLGFFISVCAAAGSLRASPAPHYNRCVSRRRVIYQRQTSGRFHLMNC